MNTEAEQRGTRDVSIDEALLNNFIYKKQKHKVLVPIYMFLTFSGLLIIPLAYFLFSSFGADTKTILVLLIYIGYVYKFHFPYKAADIEQVWFFKELSKLLNEDRERTIKSTYFFFVPDEVTEQEALAKSRQKNPPAPKRKKRAKTDAAKKKKPSTKAKK